MRIDRLPLIGDVDRWLLLNLPFVWITRVHAAVFWGGIQLLVFWQLAANLPTDLKFEPPDLILNIILTVGLIGTALMTFYWTYLKVRDNGALPHKRPFSSRLDTALSVLCISSINAGPIVFSEVYAKRVYMHSGGALIVNLIVNTAPFWSTALIVAFELIAFMTACRAVQHRTTWVVLGCLLPVALLIVIFCAGHESLTPMVGWLCLAAYILCALLLVVRPRFLPFWALGAATATFLLVTPVSVSLAVLFVNAGSSVADQDLLAAVGSGSGLALIVTFLLEGKLTALRAQPRLA